MLRLFQDSFIYGEATSSHRFREITSTQQLLFRSSCFFGASDFFWRDPFSGQSILHSSCFFRIAIFSEWNVSPSSHHLRIESSLGQLLFGTAAFLAKELFRKKISTEELVFRSRYFCTASTISEELHFVKKRIFQKSNIPHYPLFLESYLFRAATFSKDVTFYSSYFLRGATYLQHNFLEELLFHSYASFPQLYFLSIS